MLQVARLGPPALREAGHPVADYLRDSFTQDGGVANRAGVSDLYYTVFGLQGLSAFQLEPPVARVSGYLESFGHGEGQDLVHVASLARCWASLPAGTLTAERQRRIVQRLEEFRAADGSFALAPGQDQGSVYHAFLAWGAFQDLRAPTPDSESLLACLRRLETDDGAYANDATMDLGTTPVTAAAVTLLHNMGEAVPPRVGDWLLRQAAPGGGFFALPGAPMPDLLSTATALHALAALGLPPGALTEPCLDFVDSLWTGKGFCGNWSDEEEDVEYTYYGLLALGHLSL
jgi:prenyltransferase beta subunit